MTLLEMTQNIMSAMESDEINSISDTVESLQVATVIQETFYEQFLNRSVPEAESLIQLEALADLTKPNYLKIPDNVAEVKWVQYDSDEAGTGAYAKVTYMEPEAFLLRSVNSINQGSSLQVVDFSGVTFNILNDAPPKYWTSFDDLYLIFDSYNASLDDTLQTSKSLCWGRLDPVFNLEDSAVPAIDSNLFPLLLAEAKSTCFVNFKQTANAKEEQKSKRQLMRSQRHMWRARQREHTGYDLPDYSRQPR